VVPCYFPPLDLSLFGIPKRDSAGANTLDAVSIQSKHIASVGCGFLVVGVPVKVVRPFEISGKDLISDAGMLFCTIRPDRGKRFSMSRMKISMRRS
jgi:hypothetical protein